jgi:signal transduction histidine kinase
MSPVELLGKVIEISHSNLEIPSRVKAILNMISQGMRFEEALVYTFDKDKRLTCRYSNENSELFQALSRYRCYVGEGIVGGVAQRRVPQYFTHRDIPQRFGCLFYPQLDGIIYRYRAFAFLPLCDDSYLHGVLVLSASSRDILQDAEKIELSILSREIGGILRSQDLIVSSRKRISELATLSELGKVLASNVGPAALMKDILLIVSRALKARFVTIRLEESFLKLESQRFTYGAMESPLEVLVSELEEAAVKNRRPSSLADLIEREKEEPPRFSIDTSPMLSKSRVLGTITICGEPAGGESAYEANGQYVINTIANYISSGLENTVLNTKLKMAMMELGDAQKRLIEQEKFRSLGEMTANIAHEIKNPLVIIGGFTKRLAKKLTLEKTENRYIDIILKEVGRLEVILNEVLDYVKGSPAEVAACSLNDCIEEVLDLFASDSTWAQVEVLKEYDEALAEVVCDGQQMKQVFINILMNAYEAMQGRGRISIRTGRTAIEGQLFEYASFTDSGGGIEPAVIDNVFNPFFTTKERGTGLGLAISNKIVRNHGGNIEIKNAAGEGVTVVIHLPLETNITREGLL